MRVLVIGSDGMLGTDVVGELISRGHEALTPKLSDLDLTRPDQVARIAVGHWGSIDCCVNCAAYTAVDDAESEPGPATDVNALGPGYLAKACAMANVPLVHFGTDFVFDGDKDRPYTEEDECRPLGVYGQTKLDGERSVLESWHRATVFRTAWLFGVHGRSFPRTILRAWQQGRPLRVVSDQVGSPTSTEDLARIVVDSLEARLPPGLYHAAGPEATSWHGLAVRLLNVFQRVHGIGGEVGVEAIRADDWKAPARRPRYSALDSSKLASAGIRPHRPLDESLESFCRRLGPVVS